MLRTPTQDAISKTGGFFVRASSVASDLSAISGEGMPPETEIVPHRQATRPDPLCPRDDLPSTPIIRAVSVVCPYTSHPESDPVCAVHLVGSICCHEWSGRGHLMSSHPPSNPIMIAVSVVRPYTPNPRPPRPHTHISQPCHHAHFSTKEGRCRGGSLQVKIVSCKVVAFR